MAIVLPQAGDVLSADNHARLHRCVASDSAAPDQSITINAAGSAVLIAPLIFPDSTVQSTAAAGTVTSVTASGNIASTGGVNPNITFAGILPTGSGGTGTLANINTANGVVKLDGSGRLPAVDGSQLTGITTFSTGMILMWSGSIASIPSGWVLCNGSNSTPDLRNRFVVAADADVTGVANSTITGSPLQTSDGQIPAHTHTVVAAGSVSWAAGQQNSGPATRNDSGTQTSSSTGTGTYNVARFYALAYIMKT